MRIWELVHCLIVYSDDFFFQENVTRIVYVSKSQVESTSTVSGAHYDHGASDSSTICTLNNVLPPPPPPPPIGYNYHQHHPTMSSLIVPPPMVYAEEQQYAPAADVRDGNSCYNNIMLTDVKPVTRVRSYESERGTNISMRYHQPFNVNVPIS